MTEFFEIHERDGAARLSELRLSDPLVGPSNVSPVVRDAGSSWVAGRSRPAPDPAALTVLPHRAAPAGTDPRVAETFATDREPLEGPTAAVVTADTASDLGMDVYVLSGAPGLVDHTEAFLDSVMRTRRSIPEDSGLYLAGCATPANVAALVYAGVDLVDGDHAYFCGTKGVYLTRDGHAQLAELEELPCQCPACQRGLSEMDPRGCAEHNVNALETQLATVRNRIRVGGLRDFLEGQARHRIFPTEVLRRLDSEYRYLEQRAPVYRRRDMRACSEDTLRRVEIQRFADRLTSRYRPAFTDRPLVIVPCSAGKPYSESTSHGQFHDAIRWRAHKLSLTSPLGIVPQEFEFTYPAQQYDTVVTGHWSETEIAFISDVLTRYLETADYPEVIAHVPPGGYRSIVERTAASLDGADFTFTVEDHPTTDRSLGALNDALTGLDRYGKREREHNTLRAIADYFVGSGAGAALFGTALTTDGRLPKLRAHVDGTHMATLVPQYGSLSFTLAGARHWRESDAPDKRVAIDAFVPKGSVLAPGILDADEQIRVGDEVIIEGPSAFGVGRATMPGPMMASATRGMAIEVRHSEAR